LTVSEDVNEVKENVQHIYLVSQARGPYCLVGLGSTHREVLPAWPSLNPFFRVKSELESSARYITLRWISSNRVKIKSLLQYYVAQLCIGKCQSGGPGFQLRRDRRFFLFLVFALFPSRATAQREITELFSSTLNYLK